MEVQQVHVIPITKRSAPRLTTPGFYLQLIGHDYELVGAAWWLGTNPVAGLRAFTAIDEGYYAVLLKQGDGPAFEWGTLSVWNPQRGRERWLLRSRQGRPVAVPGFVVWSTPLPASIEKGGMACAVQG
jgi:hypothetical protein